jgi:hypothetical protein
VIAARRRRWGRWLAGALAIGFGVATLIEGSHVAFGGPAARAAAEPVVPFVLYFNLVAGAAYVAAGVGAVRGRGWALTLARALAATTLLVFAAFVLIVGWRRFWSPVPVEVVRVERGTVVEEAFGRGTIESQREAAVGFDLVGRLSDVLVDEATASRSARSSRASRPTRPRPTCAPRRPASARRARRCAARRRGGARAGAAGQRRARGGAHRGAGRAGACRGSRRRGRDRLRVARAELDRVLAQRAEATRGIDVASGGAEQRGSPWCGPRCWRRSTGS